MPFTYHYQQPEEYHFSLDSIELAAFVATQLQSRQDLASIRILDLCAGCGVIGMNLSWHLPSIQQIDFIEVQEIYTEYFQQNVAQINRPEVQFRWHLLNYDVLHTDEWRGTFDVIVSNPPYFLEGHGMLSPSQFKNRCRFYLDSSFHNYIRALEHALAPQGRAYFLLRSLKQHGVDLFADIQKALIANTCNAKKISQVRGTDIILLEKALKD